MSKLTITIEVANDHHISSMAPLGDESVVLVMLEVKDAMLKSPACSA